MGPHDVADDGGLVEQHEDNRGRQPGRAVLSRPLAQIQSASTDGGATDLVRVTMGDDGNRDNRNRGGRGRGGPNDGRGRSGNGRGGRGGNDRGGRGGDRRGRGGNDDRRGRGSDRRRDDTSSPTNTRSDMEYVLVTEDGCTAADIRRGTLPPRWHHVGELALLKPGLYLRRSGGLHLLSRDLVFEEAVLVTLWDDPDASYRAGNQWAKPGLHAAFLVRNPLDEGPPWLPIVASVGSEPLEYESGLLSPWYDQADAPRFAAKLERTKKGLVVRSGGAVRGSGASALLETLAWLADNPTADDAAAAIARRFLVDNGHGLQRLGLTAMHATDAERQHLLEAILPRLAPAIAPLLSSVWQLFSPSEFDSRTARERFVAVAHAMAEANAKGADASQHANLAVLATWMSGLFGLRPERDDRQPARALYAAGRVLHAVSGQLEALGHADVEMPAFPLGRDDASRLTRSLSRYPDNETDLERVVRALAIAEAGRAVSAPRLDHLRPFRIAWMLLRDWPIASRSIASRGDYVLTGWSFRGAEVRRGGADPRHLAANLIIEAPAIATMRAWARILGQGGPSTDALCECLANADHTLPRTLADLHASGPEDLAAKYREAAEQKKFTWRRLHTAIAGGEWQLARAETHDDATIDLLPPQRPEADGSAVRGHFMYWRMWCRTTSKQLGDAYRTFLDDVVPTIDELPAKLQNEVFALLRDWLRYDDANVAHAKRWQPALAARFDGILDDPEEFAAFRGERLHTLLTAFASLDPDLWLSCVDRLSRHEAFDLDAIDRILTGPAHAGWRDQLVVSETFRRLHHLLADDRTIRGARGRAEWTRQVLERAKRSGAIRWMIDGRHHAAFLASRPFVDWFADRGRAAIDAPDDAIVELIEVAVQALDDRYIERVLRTIDRATTWPDEERVKLLADRGRWAAAARAMQRTGVGDADLAERALAMLVADATNGVGVRAVGEFVRFAERSLGADVSAARAALIEQAESYKPHRHAVFGFSDAVVGWRLAGLDLAHPAIQRHVNRAAAWGTETGEAPLLEFVAHAVRSATPVVGAIPAGLDEPTALVEALAAVSIPSAAKHARRAIDESGRSKRRRGPDLGRSLTRAGLDTIEVASLGAVVQARLDDTPPEVLADALDRLVTAIHARGAAPDETPAHPEGTDAATSTDADAGEAAVDGPADAPTEGNDTPATADGEATGVDAAEATGDHEGTSDPTSEQDEASRRLADAQARTLVTGAKAWARALRTADAASILAVLPGVPRSAWPLRDRVLFDALRGPLRDLRIDDPRHLFRGDFLDDVVLLGDHADVTWLIEQIVALIDAHGLEPRVVLDRDRIALPLVLHDDAVPETETVEAGADEDETPDDDASADDDAGDATSDEDAQEDGGDVADDEVARDDTPGEDGAGEDDNESTDAPGLDEPTPADPKVAAKAARDEATRAARDRVRRGLSDRASDDEAADAWGTAGRAALVGIVTGRTPGLNVRVEKHRGKPSVVLTWRGARF